jgi:5-formyltetrahydrofolate cyclo-ligase
MTDKRRAVGRDWIRSTSRCVQDRILTMPEFLAARVIGCYVATSLEVQTDGILEACWDEPDRRVCVPAYCDEAEGYGFAWLDRDSRLGKGYGNMAEPEPVSWAALCEIDIVLLPGLAFDSRCARLGRGGGHYDRLLARFGTDRHVHKAGVAFDFQVLDRVPVSRHDVVLDAVATETRILRRSSPPEAG